LLEYKICEELSSDFMSCLQIIVAN